MRGMLYKFMINFDDNLEIFDVFFVLDKIISVFAFFEDFCVITIFFFEVRNFFLNDMMKIKLCSVHNEKKVNSCDMS